MKIKILNTNSASLIVKIWTVLEKIPHSTALKHLESQIEIYIREHYHKILAAHFMCEFLYNQMQALLLWLMHALSFIAT